ncbi:MAG: hypothetical protein HQM13_12310 [SAR324 cluster bacterium]|nr:hypothetical protein [SAR324 cluster bacterium]
MSTTIDNRTQSAFKTLAEHNILILYRWKHENYNPLIPEQQNALRISGLLNDPVNLEVLKKLIETLPELTPATYCPVPMVREMKQGVSFTRTLAEKYSYAYIKVNRKQEWFLKGVRLDQKIRKFLEENLYYEKLLNRYYVEYRVDQSMDKCYLDCEITPIVATQISIKSDHLELILNNGKIDRVDPSGFQIDDKESLFCSTQNYGEAQLADNPRYFVLKKISDDENSILVEHNAYPLSHRSN